MHYVFEASERAALQALAGSEATVESVGQLQALGWEPQKPKPPTWTVTYEKGGRTLHKKRGSWYIDDEKLGRLSDSRLVGKLRKMR